MLKGLVLAGIGFLIFVSANVLLFRLHVPKERFRVMVRLALLVAIAMTIFHRGTSPNMGVLSSSYTTAGWLIDLMNGLMVYGFLFFGYSAFYSLADRGFSGRIMMEIAASPERRLKKEDIAARYSMEGVLRQRLDYASEEKFLEKRGGCYRNTKKGRRTGLIFKFVKQFLQLGEGG